MWTAVFVSSGIHFTVKNADMETAVRLVCKEARYDSNDLDYLRVNEDDPEPMGAYEFGMRYHPDQFPMLNRAVFSERGYALGIVVYSGGRF